MRFQESETCHKNGITKNACPYQNKFGEKRSGIVTTAEYDRVYTIRASLSEPHTSVIALRKCVRIYLCLSGPTTYRNFQMSAFKYFTMIACDVHADVYTLAT